MKCKLIVVAFLIGSILSNCSKHSNTITDNNSAINPISDLKVAYDSLKNEVDISWTNPVSSSLAKVEISYSPDDLNPQASDSLIEQVAQSGVKASAILHIFSSQQYTISVVAINNAGVHSKAVSTKISVSSVPLFLKRADTLMSSLFRLYFNDVQNNVDIWKNQYPAGGGYWNGAAVVWGQGAAFSAYAALKEASENFTFYKAKYAAYDNKVANSINSFITTQGQQPQNTVSAYAVYPQNGNERFYDDNIWIGTDMADLYLLTKNPFYLTYAKLVWNFVLSGTDAMFGGGVHWKENTTGKNTCSNMPAVVLGAKLYQATNQQAYLDSAKKIYDWCKTNLQDPSDYLYWDNVSYNNTGGVSVEKSKYTYNSGQAIEAGALLYNITKATSYLKDAQNVAGSIFKQWGMQFNSTILKKTFTAIDPAGHVWFRAVMLRGLIELYKIDHNRKYINSYEDLLNNAWLSDCRQPNTNLLNYDFRGGTTQSSWEILYEGACVEMLARLGALEAESL